jgi:bacterioferritin-associated ferredoxin
MIVCVCKAVSDRTIRASIEAGATSFEELQFELGVALCCGKCTRAVEDELEASGTVSRERSRVTALQLVPVTFYDRKAA